MYIVRKQLTGLHFCVFLELFCSVRHNRKKSKMLKMLFFDKKMIKNHQQMLRTLLYISKLTWTYTAPPPPNPQCVILTVNSVLVVLNQKSSLTSTSFETKDSLPNQNLNKKFVELCDKGTTTFNRGKKKFQKKISKSQSSFFFLNKKKKREKLLNLRIVQTQARNVNKTKVGNNETKTNTI